MDSEKIVSIIENDPDYETAIVISGHSFSWGVQDLKDEKKDANGDKKPKKKGKSKKEKKVDTIDP